MKSIFLNVILEEEIYVEQLDGFVVQGEEEAVSGPFRGKKSGLSVNEMHACKPESNQTDHLR